MRPIIVVFHYDGILRSEEKEAVYFRGERRVVVIDVDVTFDRFD